MTRVAILHPTDPLGHVPGGVDSFIKGILKWAPEDLAYTLFGATSDPVARPKGRTMSATLGGRTFEFVPVASVARSSTRSRIPLTVRYMWGLRRLIKNGALDNFEILDFERIEPALLFLSDGRPKNVVLHQDYSVLREQHSDIMWRYWPWLYERLEARVLAKVDRVFAVRRSAVERYRRSWPRMAHKFLFTPTWVDSDTFRPLHEQVDKGGRRARFLGSLDASVDSKVLVFVGRLDRQKNPALLIEAFRVALARHANLHLVVIGDGILRSKVGGLCAQAGLEARVHMLGVQPASEIASILQVSDLFVLSSVYEGMPIAVLEALATGVPVVSTDVGEISTIVRNGISGRISTGNSPSELAQAICMALDELELIRGEPCLAAASPYQPRVVLDQIYENHRRQGRIASLSPSSA